MPVAAGLAVLALALVATQLVLPGVAAERLRDELAPTGRVTHARVEALPALKLLFGRADRVEVRLADARAATGEVAGLLDSTRRTGELDARVDTLHLGPLTLRDLRLRKAGTSLDAEAAVTEADLAAALPVEVGLRPVAAGGGTLVLEATAPALGSTVAVRARLSARDGALVIAPDGLLGGFASLRLFEDPRVRVTGVGARTRPGGFTLTVRGRL